MSSPRSKDRAGQSTVEFTLTLLLLMGFVLFFFQLSMMLGFANYAQYATFMAARAYLSAGENPDDQRARARKVIVQMLKQSENNPNIDRFPFIAKGTGGDGGAQGLTFDAPQFNKADRTLSWLQGIRYTFKGVLFPMSIGRGAPVPSSTSVTLISETFIGREATYDECQQEMQTQRDGGIFDNGC